MSDGYDREDSYECEECGAVFNTILPRWMLPPCCWKCSACSPWQRTDGGDAVVA